VIPRVLAPARYFVPVARSPSSAGGLPIPAPPRPAALTDGRPRLTVTKKPIPFWIEHGLSVFPPAVVPESAFLLDVVPTGRMSL